jgi:ABC-type glycerol-3-phosphate transport system substrate-binding protein
MNTKRIIALFAAILMLVCLFSACANDTAKTDSSSSSSSTSTDTKTDTKKDDTKTDDKKDDAKTDAPAEDDIEIITWLARSSDENYNLWKEKGSALLDQCVANQHQYGFEVETSFSAAEVYTTTVTSLGASGTLPQIYGTYGAIDSTTLVDWTNRGMFLSCTEVLAESSGNMVKAFGDDGLYKWARAKAAHTDGDWYIVMITNDPARYLVIQEEDGPCRVGVQLHGIYGLMTRKDWLGKLGLEMPQHPDEYYEACLRMHE